MRYHVQCLGVLIFTASKRLGYDGQVPPRKRRVSEDRIESQLVIFMYEHVQYYRNR